VEQAWASGRGKARALCSVRCCIATPIGASNGSIFLALEPRAGEQPKFSSLATLSPPVIRCSRWRCKVARARALDFIVLSLRWRKDGPLVVTWSAPFGVEAGCERVERLCFIYFRFQGDRRGAGGKKATNYTREVRHVRGDGAKVCARDVDRMNSWS
jgi:hypothetical protein